MPAREREREKPTPTCQCSVQFPQVFFLFIFNLPASFTNNKLQSDILLCDVLQLGRRKSEIN